MNVKFTRLGRREAKHLKEMRAVKAELVETKYAFAVAKEHLAYQAKEIRRRDDMDEVKAVWNDHNLTVDKQKDVTGKIATKYIAEEGLPLSSSPIGV